MVVLKIIGFLLISWLLVHFFAVFGVFLALVYPVLWILDFKKFPCLWCRIRRCADCKFSHSLLDAGLILIFTLLSLAAVFGEAKILFKIGFPPTPKTVTFVIPPKGQYRLGEIFPMKIEIAGIKVPINAVQADIGFDPSKIEVVAISTEESFANIFIQREINNVAGYARLVGGLPNPGFFSDHGVFGTVFFKGRSPGVVKVEFLRSSMVLANDGRGTNVLKDLASISYLILPEKVSLEEEEMQKQVVLQSGVLGESFAAETQMRFYEENSVLGLQVRQEPSKKKRLNLFKACLDVLEKIDRFILEQWGKIVY